MQHVKTLVKYYFQNVRVAGNEKLWRFHLNYRFYIRLVMIGVPANVGDQNICLFAFKTQHLRILQSQLKIINISENSPEWFELRQLIGSFCITNIADRKSTRLNSSHAN